MKYSNNKSAFIIATLLFTMSFGLAEAGSIIWERTLAGSFSANYTVTDVNDPGNVYVIKGADWYKHDKDGIQIGSFSLANYSQEVDVVGSNYYVAEFGNSMIGRKLDASGNILESYIYSTTTWTTSRAHGIAVDSSGNVYLAGVAYTQGNVPYNDWLVVKFSPTGTVLWVNYETEPPTTNVIAQEAEVIGNYLYVYGIRNLATGTPLVKAKKYDVASPTVSVVASSTNTGGQVSAQIRAYNNQLYQLSGSGRIYQADLSTLTLNATLIAEPTIPPTLNYDCQYLYPGHGSFISSSGIVWTVGTCQTNPNFKHYVSRFNLNTLQVSGPHYVGNFAPTHSAPTDPGGAVFSENNNIVYIAGAKDLGAYLGPTLYRYSTLTCNGPFPAYTTWSVDNPRVASGTTAIKALHITELRDRINDLQTDAGLATTTWTDGSSLTGIATKAQHINEMRGALNGVYSTCGQPAITWTDHPTVTTGVTPIRAQHLNELRQYVEQAK